MKLYDTVYQEAKAEYITQKSRFIAHISPVDSCDEAKAFISSIKSEYKDATHNVPVMVVGDKPYFMEVNTLPGMTAASLLPKSTASKGYSYVETLDLLIEASRNIKR